MNVKDVATYTGLPTNSIEKMLKGSPHQTYRSQEYIDALHSVDLEALEAALPEARRVYEAHLPDFAAGLEARYGVSSSPMSPFTLGNWVVGVMQYPERADTIIKMHKALPANVFADNLDELVGMLDEMRSGSAVWQQAMCLLAFPLMSG